MGMKDKEIRRVFPCDFRISVGAVSIGIVLGIVLSYVSLPILGFFAKSGIAAFSYYLLSFPIRIPVVRILLVIAFLFVLSMASAAVSLDRIKRSSRSRLFRHNPVCAERTYLLYLVHEF